MGAGGVFWCVGMEGVGGEWFAPLQATTLQPHGAGLDDISPGSAHEGEPPWSMVIIHFVSALTVECGMLGHAINKEYGMITTA